MTALGNGSNVWVLHGWWQIGTTAVFCPCEARSSIYGLISAKCSSDHTSTPCHPYIQEKVVVAHIRQVDVGDFHLDLCRDRLLAGSFDHCTAAIHPCRDAPGDFGRDVDRSGAYDAEPGHVLKDIHHGAGFRSRDRSNQSGAQSRCRYDRRAAGKIGEADVCKQRRISLNQETQGDYAVPACQRPERPCRHLGYF